MKYEKNQDTFLGSSKDCAGNNFDAFKVEDNITIVYGLDTDEEYATSKPIKDIVKNIDKYLFTPYGEFGAQFLKLSDIT